MSPAFARIRQSKRITQEELASRSGISVTGLQQIEAGACNPMYSTFFNIGLGMFGSVEDYAKDPIARWDGEKLYDLRKINGLSQKKLGLMAGVRNKDISRWENGVEPKAQSIDRLSKVLKVRPSTFFSLSEEGKGNNLDDIERSVFIMSLVTLCTAGTGKPKNSQLYRCVTYLAYLQNVA